MTDPIKPVGQTTPQAAPPQSGQVEFPPWVEWAGYIAGGAAVAAILLYRKYRQEAWELYLKVVKDITGRIDRVCKNHVEPSARDNFYKDPKLTLLIKILYQAQATLASTSAIARAQGNTPWHVNNLDQEIDNLIRQRCNGQYKPVTQEEFQYAKKKVNPQNPLWFVAEPDPQPATRPVAQIPPEKIPVSAALPDEKAVAEGFAVTGFAYAMKMLFDAAGTAATVAPTLESTLPAAVPATGFIPIFTVVPSSILEEMIRRFDKIPSA